MAALAAAALLSACGPTADPPPAAPDLAGSWRAVLASPGGELPFQLEIDRAGDELVASVVNGSERAPLSGVDVDGRQVTLRFDGYDSRIAARLSQDGRSMAGEWTKTAAGGALTRLPFEAVRGDQRRFLERAESGLDPGASEAPPEVGGVYSVVFTDEDGTEPARAELEQRGERVTGTFLTPTGDYRFLEGRYEDGLLRLSTYDGAHAFLFHARADVSGALSGDFWSRDTYHATWTAAPADPSETILPDAWEQVGLTNDDGRLRFSFPDLEGRRVSLADPRFDGKGVVVVIFGSWCPNCNDEAPLLAEWYRRYRDRGLEIVGLAYEYTGDPERDRRQVARYAERYGIEFPLLVAGVSDKQEAAATLPDLTAVLAYPTTIFVGRDGRVRKIHSGFAGPGTGAHHAELVAELEAAIEEILAEPPPVGAAG